MERDDWDEDNALDLTEPKKRDRRVRFKGFLERTKALHITAYTVPDPLTAASNVSYFHQELTAQQDRNYLEDFSAFFWDVSPLSETLPLLLLHRQKVVASLLARLPTADRESQRMMLLVIPALARDLQTQFYEFFEGSLSCLLQVLNPEDLQLTEEVLQCVAFILKFLRSVLLQNFFDVFKLFDVLLAHRKFYVRELASEVLAFLVRKLPAKKGLDEFVKLVWGKAPRALEAGDDVVQESERYVEGMSAMLYHTMKGISGHVHSVSQRLIPALFLSIRGAPDAHFAGDVVERLSLRFVRMLRKSGFVGELDLWWSSLLECLDEQTVLLNGPSSASSAALIPYLIRSVMTVFPTVQDTRFCDMDAALQKCAKGAAAGDEALAMLLVNVLDKRVSKCKEKTTLMAASYIVNLSPSVTAHALPELASRVTRISQEALVSLCKALCVVKLTPVSLPHILQFLAGLGSLNPDSAQGFWQAFDARSLLDKMIPLALKSDVEDVVLGGFSVCHLLLRVTGTKNAGHVVHKLAVPLESNKSNRVRCRARELVQACGVQSRVEQSIKEMLKNPEDADVVATCAFCLASDQQQGSARSFHIDEGAILTALSKSLRARSFHLRISAAEVASVFVGDAVKRLVEVERTNYLKWSNVKKLASMVERAGLDFQRGLVSAAHVPTVIRVLLGCLHVRFAPVSDAAMETLKLFANEAVLWQELRIVLSELADEWDKSAASQASGNGDPLADGDGGTVSAEPDPQVLMEQPKPAVWTWTALMKQLLPSAPAQHCAWVVPAFLDSVSLLKAELAARKQEELDAFDESTTTAASSSSSSTGGRSSQRHLRVRLWLGVFTELRHVRSFAQWQSLIPVCEEMLDSDDSVVQKAALKIFCDLGPVKSLKEFSQLFNAIVDADHALTSMLNDLHFETIQDQTLRRQFISVFSVLVHRLLQRSAPQSAVTSSLTFIIKHFNGSSADAFVTRVFQPLIVGSVKSSDLAEDDQATFFVAADSDVLSRISPKRAGAVGRVIRQVLTVWKGDALRYWKLFLAATRWLLDLDSDTGVDLFALLIQNFGSKEFGNAVIESLARIAMVQFPPCLEEQNASRKASLWMRIFVLSSENLARMEAFFRAPGIVPTLFSCLTVGWARREALVALWNLIPSSSEQGVQSISLFRRAVAPHVELLFNALAEIEFDIAFPLIVRLSTVVDKTNAQRMFDLLLQVKDEPLKYFKATSKRRRKRHSDDDEKEAAAADHDAAMDRLNEILNDAEDDDSVSKSFVVRVVDMMVGLVPNLPAENVDKNVVSLIALILGERVKLDRMLSVRVCNMLEALSTTHAPRYAQCISALANMLAFSEVVLDQVDTNRRLMGIDKAAQLLTELSERDVQEQSPFVVALLYPLLYLCTTRDLSTREQAAANVVALIQRSGGPQCPVLFDEVVLPWLWRAVTNAGVRQVQQTLMTVIRQCVVQFHERFRDLLVLVSHNDDAETEDFFLALFYPTVSVRIGAMQKFQAALSSASAAGTTLDDSLLSDFLLPMFDGCLTMSSGVKKEELKAFRREIAKTLQSIGTHLPWDSWTFYLDKLTGSDRLGPDGKMTPVTVYAYCAFAESFHFEHSEEVMEYLQGAVLRNLHASLLNEPNVDEKTRDKGKTIKGKALDGTTVNVQVAFSTVRLLRKLPKDVARSRIGALVRSICNCLAERDEKIREYTRTSLAQVAKELGPAYFESFFVGMRGALKRGFEVYVLYYSLHHLLSQLRQAFLANPGSLDHVAGRVSALLLEDILGATAASKEIGKIQAKVMEARSSKSYRSFTLLAECVSFPSIAWEQKAFQHMFQPVVDMLQFAKKRKDVERLRDVLAAILQGLCANPTVQLEPMLKFCYNLIAENANASGDGNDNGNDGANKKKKELIELPPSGAYHSLSKARRVTVSDVIEQNNYFKVEKTKREEFNQTMEKEDHFETNRHLLGEFGLNMLLAAFDKSKTRDRSERTELFGPFVQLCANVRGQDRLLELANTCLRKLVKWHSSFPVFEESSVVAETVAQNALKTLKTTDPMKDLGRSCFAVVAALAKYLPNWQLTEDNIEFLAELIQQEIDHSTELSSVLSVLRWFVTKKVLTPTMYSLMERLQTLCITHHDVQTRQACASIFIGFLVRFPLTKRKFSTHLNRIIADLGFEEPSGRIAALELLNVAFHKFPPPMLVELTNSVFIPLVLRLANESDQGVRAVTAQALTVLFSKVDEETLVSLMGYCFKWYGGADVQRQVEGGADGGSGLRALESKSEIALGAAAAQVMGLLIDSDRVSKADRKQALRLLQNRAIEMAQGAARVGEVFGGEYLHVDALMYQSCLSLEKCVAKERAAVLTKHLAFVHNATYGCNILEYPHAWVRLSCLRLLDVLATRDLLTSWSDASFCAVARSACVVLEEGGEESMALSLKLIVDLILSLCKRSSASVKGGGDDDDEDERDVNDGEDGGAAAITEEPDASYQPLKWIIWRLATLTITCSAELRDAIFKTFAALIAKFPQPIATSVAPVMLYPMYLASPWDEDKGEQLNFALLGRFKKHLGLNPFTAACNKVREVVGKQKQRNREKSAREFVVSPVSANRKKLKTLRPSKSKKKDF